MDFAVVDTMDVSTGYEKRSRIIIVDDDTAVLNLLSKKLELLGYICDTEADGLRAIHRVKAGQYDAAILDVNMPYIDGTEMLYFLRRTDPDIPVLMISGMDSIDIVRKTLREGAYDYLVKPLSLDELEVSVKRALQHGHLSRQIKQNQLNLEQQVADRTRELASALEEVNETYDATILALGSALETGDIETQSHSVRVAYFSCLLASALGLSEGWRLTDIERGAYLHDIGNIGVPDAILRKPMALDDEEWVIMKRHPRIGKDIIEGIDYLRGSTPLVYCHHEKYDGTGYPRGLAGEEIPFDARIFAVADALDAMISDRPYRKAMTLDAATREIHEKRGAHFDPAVVDTLLGIGEAELGIETHETYEGIKLRLAKLRSAAAT
jgi:response regulator RpfG family c-di-GMP phosphodiesterase